MIVRSTRPPRTTRIVYLVLDCPEPDAQVLAASFDDETARAYCSRVGGTWSWEEHRQDRARRLVETYGCPPALSVVR